MGKLTIPVIIEIEGALVRGVYVPKEVEEQAAFDVEVLDLDYSDLPEKAEKQMAQDAPLLKKVESGEWREVRWYEWKQKLFDKEFECPRCHGWVDNKTSIDKHGMCGKCFHLWQAGALPEQQEVA